MNRLPQRATIRVSSIHDSRSIARAGECHIICKHRSEKVVLGLIAIDKPPFKEGKNAVRWTKRSCRIFKDNQTRLQLFPLEYNLGNFLRRLALEAQRRCCVAVFQDDLTLLPNPDHIKKFGR